MPKYMLIRSAAHTEFLKDKHSRVLLFIWSRCVCVGGVNAHGDVFVKPWDTSAWILSFTLSKRDRNVI